MDQAVQDFIVCKRLAVVGASRSGNKFGNRAAQELQERGCEVFLVHPHADQIDGQPCYPDLAALQGQVDAVFVSLPAHQAGDVLRQASGLGLRNVWLQQGADTPELLAQASGLDLDLVHGKCVLMYAPPVRSFHNFHRVIWKLIGKY